MKDLYQKLRLIVKPTKLKSVIGQESAINFLSNCVEKSFVPQALMFYGPFGVGKTATARIMARSMNCLNTEKPCWSCEGCTSEFDFLEFNSSHYSGIDDIKEIIKGVKFKPFVAKFKVYILDEIHMLTIKSFNTLLKEIEDAPEFVRFIGITTDMSMIPDVFLSRFVTVRFQPVGDLELENYLKNVVAIVRKDSALSAALPEYSETDIKKIVADAKGSVRQALHILIRADTEALFLNDRRFLSELRKGFSNVIGLVNEMSTSKTPYEIVQTFLEEITEEIIKAWEEKNHSRIESLNKIFEVLNLILAQRFLKKESIICAISQIYLKLTDARKK